MGREMMINIKISNLSCRILIMSLFAMLLIVPTILPVSATTNQQEAKWTFMVYLDADNNLDSFSLKNIEAMKSVGSTQDVNIIVLWDRYDDVANLYRVEANKLSIIQGFPLNDREVNMGDSATLSEFVQFTEDSFPASNYALVLWDHGDDCRGCCWDDHPEDCLTHQEIVNALSDIHLNILAFDACVEGMIEVAYEYSWLSAQVDYMVASEGYVPSMGYPYADILGALISNPDVSAYELSSNIVDAYVSYYETAKPASRLVELGVIDMSHIEQIVQQLGTLTDELEGLLQGDTKGNYHGMISKARAAGTMGWSEYGWEAYIDLPSFTQTLACCGFVQATILYESLMDAIYAKASWSMKSANGMGIFFPSSYASFKNKDILHGDDYLNMQFPKEGFWDFLLAYWGK
jgi:hypothetical protein